MSDEEDSSVPVPRVRIEDGETLTNSRDVAEWFEKRPGDVLRDIRALEIDADLRRSWFRERMQPDAYGREQISIDMTRDGFTILVMGWTGARAMEFKIRYIQAFNEKDAALKDAANKASEAAKDGDIIKLTAAVADIAQAQLNSDARQLSLFSFFQTMQTGQVAVERKIEDLTEHLFKIYPERKPLKEATMRRHREATLSEFNGFCPCCGHVVVVNEDGSRAKLARYDHAIARNLRGFEHTWLICFDCNSGLGNGKISRTERMREFEVYQNRAKRDLGPLFRQTRKRS